MIQIFEWTDKDFNTTVVNMLQKIYEKMNNFTAELEFINQFWFWNTKSKI